MSGPDNDRGAAGAAPRGTTPGRAARGGGRTVAHGDVAVPLNVCADVLDESYERLKKARQRNPDTFPTVTIAGHDLHRPHDVASWFLQAPSRGRPPRTRASDNGT